ncbi:MAG: ABC transporter permease, partial [Symploca sp. SIO2B6]|nr:ABC transporter permease [Symploca sp. SIO2B6]
MSTSCVAGVVAIAPTQDIAFTVAKAFSGYNNLDLCVFANDDFISFIFYLLPIYLSMSLTPPDLIRFAYLSLKGNPVRSLLSTVGVFMGVLAVSATLEARNLGQAYLAKQLSQQDAPQIFVYSIRPSNGLERIRLRPSDVSLLRQRLLGWQAIGAQRWVGGSENVLFEGQEAPGFLIAVSPNHLETSGRQLLSGRFFTPTDIEKYRAVVVIDAWLENELFAGESAIGQQIHVANNSYQVIGVINFLNGNREEPRGDVMMSLAMATAIRGQDIVGRINIRP